MYGTVRYDGSNSESCCPSALAREPSASEPKSEIQRCNMSSSLSTECGRVYELACARGGVRVVGSLALRGCGRQRAVVSQIFTLNACDYFGTQKQVPCRCVYEP